MGRSQPFYKKSRCQFGVIHIAKENMGHLHQAELSNLCFAPVLIQRIRVRYVFFILRKIVDNNEQYDWPSNLFFFVYRAIAVDH